MRATEVQNQNFLLSAYTALFKFVAQKRITRGDIDLREVHALIITVVMTSFLLSIYSALIVLFMNNDFISAIGVISTLVVLLCPLLFLYTNNSFLVSNILLAAPTTLIVAGAYFNRGLENYTILFLPATPMLASIISGKKGTKLWAFIGFSILMVFAVLTLQGHKFPSHIGELGLRISLYVMIFGWMGMASILSFLFITLSENSENLLIEQTQKVDSLFRVLFHDLANSLGRINIGHAIAKKDQGGSPGRGLVIASEAADSMFEITQNVRRMYAVSKGKADMELSLHPLNECIDYVAKIFSEDFERKKIKLRWDPKNIDGLKLMVEPVSFKNQVLGNIISNAIKFSPENSTILIHAYAINPNLFSVEIRDAGIGMPQVILSQLFDLNKKTSRPGTAGEFGTGFGMHIMKSFMEIYQGQVKVESVEGGVDATSGTTFKLLLKGEWAP